jgi:peptidoglycan hydrolase-like protein with peptidoglycan-binding domain
MFTKEITDAVLAAAKKYDIPASSLLAVVECETSGAPYEQDGRTPRLLFERHKFYSELKLHQPQKLAAAVKAGLAIPKWSRTTQYKDQGTSAGRLAVIAKARAIDEEVANRATSWGLGQTMGFNAERLGYDNAIDMVQRMTEGRVAEQVRAMMQEILRSKLDGHLRNKDFAKFARGYNGPGYAQNQYDTRMAAAEKRWARTLANQDVTVALPSATDTKLIQAKLKAKGYPVGSVDGKWGDLTTGAMSAFQKREGLKVTGMINAETREVLFDPDTEDRKIDPARAAATEKDLRAAGSTTIAAADKGSFINKLVVGAGALGGAEKLGILDQAQGVVDKVSAAKSLVDTIRDLATGIMPYWWIAAIGIGVYGIYTYRDVIKARLAEHRSGLNLGL